MNVQHKLEGFMDIVLKEATEKREQILRKIEDEFESSCNEIRKNAEKEANERYINECYIAEQKKNKVIMQAAIDSKKAVVELRNRYWDEMFDRVRCRIKEFVQSDEYEGFLLTKIKDACSQNADSTVYLSPEDMIYADKIKDMTGCSVFEYENGEDLIGGFKLKINSKNAIIDSSFKAGLEEVRQDYSAFKITN